MSKGRLQCLRSFFFFSVLCWGIVLPVQAAPILTPSGLNPGDMYQLAFVTSSTRDATSTDIADYNTFVQGVADAAMIGSTSPLGPIMWNAIASTALVSALANADVSAPVYNLGDQRVADGAADMWDDTLLVPINFDETGDPHSGQAVWTGTNSTGTQLNVLGDTSSTVGIPNVDTLNWIMTLNPQPSSGLRSLYALSVPLTVPQVPIPSSLLLFGSGLVALVGWRRWKGRLT